MDSQREPAAPRSVQLTWKDVEDGCRAVAALIRNSPFRPDVVVGIQRGGCVPAVFLSHLLQVAELCTVGVKTTTSDDVRAIRQVPVIYDALSLSRVRGHRVLLVDDVVNTGTTLIAAKECVQNSGSVEVRTAAIIWDTVGASICQADYVGRRIDAWIVFPWEQ